MRTLGALWLSVCLGACGDDAPGSDPGGGSETLLVNASVDHEGGGAEFQVTVDRGALDVLDAMVWIESNHGEVVLTHVGGGEYRGGQPLWGDWYALRVEAGEDWLDGSVEAPVMPVIVEPSTAAAIDPHTVPDGMVRVAWDGEAAMAVRVRAAEFDVDMPDEGSVLVPATFFTDQEVEIEVRRENSTNLAGGVAGSHLDAQIQSQTRVFVTNPF